MKEVKIHILHVGDMTNKGTEALIRSDVATLHELFDDASISVSTTDIEGVKEIGMDCTVMPVMIDIPYKIADSLGGKDLSRNSIQYKIYAVIGLILMFMQTVALFISSLFVKTGLPGFYRTGLIERLKECDVIISGSDENFKEAASLLPTNIYWKVTWWSILFKRTIEMVICKLFEKPTIMFPNSLGPFRSVIGRFLSRLAFRNMDIIIVREPISWDILESLNVPTESYLTSDAALLFKPRGDPPQDIVTHPTLCICTGVYSQTLSPDEMDSFIDAHAIAADFAIRELDLEVVFMPHYITGFEMDDLHVSKLILERMKYKEKAKIVEVSTLDEFKHRLNFMDVLVSAKMHPAVLGVSGYVPTLCIAYDHKQIGFFKILEMPECVIKIRDVTSENLVDTLYYINKNKEKLRSNLIEKIPELQSVIKETMESSLDKLLNGDREP
jgi:polysaccharide pyruvyl transferase WcaK-like protein